MPKWPNKPTDVFKYIDMHGGNPEPCWEWKRHAKGGGRDNRPYFDVQGKKYLVYRLVWMLYKGKDFLPDNIMLRHKCDNPRCCNPHHVEEGTHQENMDDMKVRERHGLTHHAVRAIRKLLANGESCASVARKFGVSRTNISAIKRGLTYQHVKEAQGEDDE